MDLGHENVLGIQFLFSIIAKILLIEQYENEFFEFQLINYNRNLKFTNYNCKTQLINRVTDNHHNLQLQLGTANNLQITMTACNYNLQ